MAKKEKEKEVEPLDGQLQLESNGETTEIKSPNKKKSSSKNSTKNKQETNKKSEKKSSSKSSTKNKQETEKKSSSTNSTKKKSESGNAKEKKKSSENKSSEKKLEEKPDSNKTETKKSDSKKPNNKNSNQNKKNNKNKENKKQEKPVEKVEETSVEKDEKEKTEKQIEKTDQSKSSKGKKNTDKKDTTPKSQVDSIVLTEKTVSKKQEKNKILLDEAFANFENVLTDFDSSFDKKKKEKSKEEEKTKEEKTEEEKTGEKVKAEKKDEPQKDELLEEKEAKAEKESDKDKSPEGLKDKEKSFDEKIKVISLPSKGSLKDIKGEEIEEFIEVTEEDPDEKPKTRKEKKKEQIIEEEVGIEPAEKLEPAGENIKPLPKFLTHFVPIRGDKIGEIIRKGIVDICIVLLIVSMTVLIKSTRSASSNESQNGNLITNYALSFDINSKTSSMPSNILEKYYSLYNTNNNLVGWLTIHNTQIDLPVLKYSDNSHYATYDFFEKALSGINAYADSKCNMEKLGDVTVIYVAKSSSVESINGISEYKNPDFNLTTVEFGTIYSDMTWKLIACVTDEKAIETLLSTMDDRTTFNKCVEENNVYEKNEESSLDIDDQVLLIQIPESDKSQILLIAKRINEKNIDH